MIFHVSVVFTTEITNSDWDHDGGFLASTNQTIAVYMSATPSVQRHSAKVLLHTWKV